METKCGLLILLFVYCLGGFYLLAPPSLVTDMDRSVQCSSSSYAVYTFQEIGISSFNVSFQQQQKQVSFTVSFNGSCRAHISLYYFLGKNASPTAVDVYLNKNHTEGFLQPLQSCHQFWLNTSLHERNRFTLISDIPGVHRLTIFGNSTITLYQRTETNPQDSEPENENQLPTTYLQIMLVASYVFPILIGIYFERYQTKEPKREKTREENEKEIVVF